MIRAVCIEVGGGSIQTALFDGAPEPSFVAGAREEPGAPLLMAVPGIVEGSRVRAASNLGWYDVDPVERLGLRGPAAVVCNDAEAAALGEATLHGEDALAYLGLGTGIGGVIVRAGRVVEREVFGHRGIFSDTACSCGRTGCLETVAAGWALPDPIPRALFEPIASALAHAVAAADAPDTIVVGGGIARRFPGIISAMSERLPDRTILRSRAPAAAKSAAAWGLLRLAGIPLSAQPAPAPPRTARR